MVMSKLSQMPPRLPGLPTRLASPPKRAEGFYQTPEWRGLVAQLKRERGNYCERCGSSYRVIADHIIERKDGGAPLDKANIELLCQACHNTKTAASRAKRATGL